MNYHTTFDKTAMCLLFSVTMQKLYEAVETMNFMQSLCDVVMVYDIIDLHSARYDLRPE